jgi:hypothetical protein
MMKIKSIFSALTIVIVLLTVASCSYRRKVTAENIQLDPIYSSNMVFKEGDSLRVSGYCNANGTLAIKLQDGLQFVDADNAGRWTVKFPPFKYDGIFSITIEGINEQIILDNLVTGELWVVAGDLWLENSLKTLESKTNLTGRGDNQDVRIYSPGSLINNPAGNRVSWQVHQISGISLKEIYPSLLGDELALLKNKAIGIINLAHVGTAIRDFDAGEREQAGEAIDGYDIDSLWRAYYAGQQSYKRLADSSFRGLDRDVLDRRYDDWEWSETEFPLITGKRWYMKNRILWLRKKIYIAEKYKTSDFTIEMGTLRGQFNFYFNGAQVAAFKGESSDYKLTIPDSLVKTWTNLFTIRMVAGDSLSGLYNETPMVYNADSSYRMQITENWRIRTYYEPALPTVQKNSYLWPRVFENYFLKFKGFAANGLIFAGSVHQYAQTNEELITSGIASIQELIKSDNYYLYLIPRPTYIEQNFNGDYYNTIRNNQLAAAANRAMENYKYPGYYARRQLSELFC